jgi:hypothetical protein
VERAQLNLLQQLHMVASDLKEHQNECTVRHADMIGMVQRMQEQQTCMVTELQHLRELMLVTGSSNWKTEASSAAAARPARPTKLRHAGLGSTLRNEQKHTRSLRHTEAFPASTRTEEAHIPAVSNAASDILSPRSAEAAVSTASGELCCSHTLPVLVPYSWQGNHKLLEQCGRHAVAICLM